MDKNSFFIGIIGDLGHLGVIGKVLPLMRQPLYRGNVHRRGMTICFIKPYPALRAGTNRPAGSCSETLANLDGRKGTFPTAPISPKQKLPGIHMIDAAGHKGHFNSSVYIPPYICAASAAHLRDSRTTKVAND